MNILLLITILLTLPTTKEMEKYGGKLECSRSSHPNAVQIVKGTKCLYGENCICSWAYDDELHICSCHTKLDSEIRKVKIGLLSPNSVPITTGKEQIGYFVHHDTLDIFYTDSIKVSYEWNNQELKLINQ